MSRAVLRRYLPLWVPVGLLLLGSLSESAWGQFALDAGGATSGPELFRTVPREMGLALASAQKAVADGRGQDAIDLLSAIINPEEAEFSRLKPDDAAQDYFEPADPQDPTKKGTLTSVKARAQRMLGSLPEKMRELYQLKFGQIADLRLRDAIVTGDLQELQGVGRRYFHTKAGYDATFLAGRLELERGQPLGAAMTLQRLRDESPAAGQYEPELSLLLASAWRYAGNAELASETVKQLIARGGGRVKIGGKEVPVPRAGEDPLVWLAAVLPQENLAGETAGVESEWRLYRGNPARNATTIGDMPLAYRGMQLRWQLPVVNNPTEEIEVGKQFKSQLDDSVPVIPSLHPLAVGNQLLMRTPNKIVGVDFETGKRIWQYPPGDNEEENSTQPPAPQFNGLQMNAQNFSRGGQLRQRIWQDLPYGQISSDGERVFVLDSLSFVTTNPNYAVNRFGMRNVDQSNKPQSELVALELKTEGKIAWSVGGTGSNEPRLEGAFFLGPPLPVLDQLFVLVEMNGEIRLVSLDPKEGKELWSQQLAMMDRQVTLDPARRLAGATPSFADGTLVCPTGAGAVVAVDVATRRLRWGFEYRKEINELNPQLMQIRRAQAAQQRLTTPSWVDNTVTLARGVVVLTPVDDESRMFGIDLLTGAKKWERDRGDMLFVAGVAGDRVIIVGKSQVTAARLDDGKDAWKAPRTFPTGEMPSGRGFISGNFYFQPTTGRKLLKIDTTTGTIVDQIETETMLGNLVCYKDELISQSHESVTTYYQLGALRRRVVDTLKTKPADIWSLARLGELQLYDGDRVQALATLRKAHQLAPDGSPELQELETLLVTTLLAELRVNFAENERLAAEVEELVKEPEQRIEYLRLMAQGWQKAGQSQRAFETYLKLADQTPADDNRVVRDPAQLDQIDPRWQVRRERWLAVRLAELLREAQGPQVAALNAAAQERLDAARANTGVGMLRRAIDLFALYPAAGPAKLELARRLMASSEYTEAEQVLLSLDDSPRPELAASAYALYADLLVRCGRPEEAAAHYQRLAGRFADVKNLDGKTGKQILAALPEQSPLRALLVGPTPWAGGKVEELAARPTEGRQSYGQRSYQVPIRRQEGPLAPGTQLAIELNSSLLVNNGLGQTLLRVPLLQQNARYVNSAYVTNYALGRGHLLIGNIGLEVLAIDTLRPQDPKQENRILWRQDVARPNMTNTIGIQPRTVIKTPTSAWGTPRAGQLELGNKLMGGVGPVSEQGICFQRMRDIVCLDPLTGEMLWQRDGFDAGCDLFGDETLLVVIQPDEKDKDADSEVVFLDPLDGREVGRGKAPRSDMRWVSVGRNLLTWSDAGEKRTLKLVDLMDKNRVVWSFETSSQAKGVIVGGDEVAILDPAGKFDVLGLADGSSRISAQVEPETKLTEINVLRSGRQYILLANQGPPDTYGNNVSISPAPGGFQTVLQRGRVYAFDRVTRKATWQAPAYVDSYGFPLDQPSELPVLVFLRQVVKPQPNGTREMRTDVLCLDRRDGRPLMDRTDLKMQTNFFSVKGDPPQQTVTLELPNGMVYALKFTDQPTPPMAPAQNGDQTAAQGGKQGRVELKRPPVDDPFGPPDLIVPADPFGGPAPIPLPRLAPPRNR